MGSACEQLTFFEELYSLRRRSEDLKEKIENFIFREVMDFQEEANLCLEYCENQGQYHLVSYWIEGIYVSVREFLTEEYCEELADVVMELYPNNHIDFKNKLELKYGYVDNKVIALEGLSSILLKQLQMYYQWYTIFGCEEDDILDFSKYNVVEAVRNTDEFPIIKSEDVVAAMYGINTHVQPSDLYDVFAHYADELRIKDEKDNDEVHQEEAIFTPDVFMTCGVVGRYKQYIDLIKRPASDMAFQFYEIDRIEDKELKDTLLLSSAVNDYYNRYSVAPKGLPLHKDMVTAEIIEEGGERKYLLHYKIRGVKAHKVCWDNICDIVYEIPQDLNGYIDFIVNIAIDFKRELNGLEKVRNQDIDAIPGKYPTRFSATHGLCYIKDANVHYKDKRGNDRRKIAKPTFSLALAEKQSLYIIKKALRYGVNNTTISSSFGIDSTVVTHLTMRVNKTNFNLAHNNSHVEYPQLLAFKARELKRLNLKGRYYETHPVESFWSLQERNGFNMVRKGDRSQKGTNASEECCRKLKHIPMYNLLDELESNKNPIQLNFSGLRGLESRARLQQGKRDSAVYLAKTWRSIRVNPIVFWTDEMVWDYQRKYKFDYCDIYNMKVYYSDVYDNVTDEERDEVLYSARVGCLPCLINTKGYLFFLRKYFNKLYKYMMFEKGLALTLFERGGKKIGILSKDEDSSSSMTGQLSLFNMDEEGNPKAFSNQEILDSYSLEAMENAIIRRPCKFLE